MKGQRDFWLLTGIMAVVSASILIMMNFSLYNTAFEQTRARLIETVQSQAMMMNAVARFDKKYSARVFPGTAFEATLGQIIDGLEKLKFSRELFEFTLGRREGDNIRYLLRIRGEESDAPGVIPYRGKLAEPMKRALTGESGTVVGLDYRGVTVLAAYEPVREMGLGVVAKADISEIRRPFVETGVKTGLIALVVVILGAWLFSRITQPMLQRLRESEERFRNMAECSPLMIWLTGKDRLPTYFNKSWLEFTGRTLEQELGEGWLEGVHPDDLGHVLNERKKAAESTEISAIEYRLRRYDGEYRWLRDSAAALHDEHGTFSGLIGSTTDITDLRRAEMERGEFIAELEAKNAELEQFTYTVSHDLKSPLITIKGFLGLLEKDLAEGEAGAARDDMERIYNAADKMARLLEGLLNLSRVGRLLNPPQKVSFDELAREAVELLSGPIAEAGVQVEISDGLPVAVADRQRLLTVMQNLIENAVKCMGDQPEPRIEIGGSREADEALVYVRDNGTGIDPRYHEKIFGLFNKLNHTEEGSGIGLALVRRIVKLHGGRVWVESEGRGRGSTFFFAVPVEGKHLRQAEQPMNNPPPIKRALR